MKKYLFFLFLLFFTVKIFAQQFSQYNTGTLYDSFENPAQKGFITDSSKMFASNFLVPNIDANFFLSGNSQTTLKSRAFLNKYNNAALLINQGKNNQINANVNAYWIMFKMFASFNGDQEMGISAQTKIETRGLYSDESIALFNGTQSFNNGSYDNVFHDNFLYQAYNQISFTYKEKFNKQFSFGMKLGLLLGVHYQKLNITNSSVVFDKVLDAANLALAGTYQESYVPGNTSQTRDFLPTFRNPGASITIGAMFKTEDKFTLQANIKDMGFIHWSSLSSVYNYNNSAIIRGLSTAAREDSIYRKVSSIVHNNGVVKSFNTPVNGRAELSVMKSFWLDDDKMFKYSPTLIASKELFYPGFTGALVNPIQYKKYNLTLITTYDDLKIFNLGAQFMLQTPNFEFFIGSDKIAQTGSFFYQGLSKNVSSNGSFSGSDFFLGFSLKFGPIIEHPMNASSIPGGEKGFLSRFFGRLFKTNN